MIEDRILSHLSTAAHIAILAWVGMQMVEAGIVVVTQAALVVFALSALVVFALYWFQRWYEHRRKREEDDE